MSRRRQGLALVLFAKAPVPGSVKTRLVPPLRPEAAAALQEALLRDTAALVVESVHFERPRPRLYCAAGAPTDEVPLRRLLPAEFEIVAQGEGDLGKRLEHVFAGLLSRHAAAIAIGADCLDLTPAVLRGAFDALRRKSAVLGRAGDGGYWAIGLRRAWPELFRDMPWSTSQVAERTARRMRELGLEIEELSVLRDADRFQDLLDWARRPNTLLPRTVAWCREQGLL